MAGEGFPGMGGDTVPLPSNDPVLPEGIPAQTFASQAASNVTTSIERAAMLSGDIERNFNLILDRISTVAHDVGASAQGGTSAAAGSPGDHRAPSSDPANSAPLTAPAGMPEGRWGRDAPQPGRPRVAGQRRTRVSEDVEEVEEELTPPTEAYKEGRQAVQDLSMSGILKAIGKSATAPAARYASEHGPNWGVDEATGDYVQKDPDTGEVTNRVAAGTPEHERLGRSISRGGFLAGHAARALGGEGIVGSLGAVASKVAGPIGLAVGAVSMVGHGIENQNEKAQGYRADFGQSGTGVFAAKERFGERLAGIQGFGSIGGERAREQYRQASALGLRGDQREQATDFAGDMYLKMGMDTSESMQIVKQAITSGNASLSEFGDAIKEVSKAAVAAGVSSRDAIKEFAEAQDAVSRNIVSGTPSIAVAKNLQGVAESLGKPLSEAIGGASGLAGTLNQRNVMNAAALSGQDPTAALFRLSAPGTAAAQAQKSLAQIGDLVVEQVAATIPGMSREQMRASYEEASGGTGDLSPDQQSSLLLQWCQGDQSLAGQALLVISTVLSQYGMNYDQAQQLNFFMQAVSGKLAGEGSKGGHAKHGGPVTSAKRTDPVSRKAETIKYSKGGGADQTEAIRQSLGYGFRAIGGGRGGAVQAAPEPVGNEGAFNAYVSEVSKSGVGDARIQALLSKGRQDDIEHAAGVGNAEDAKYKVMGKDNKAHLVSLEEAIRDPLYRSQLASGEASIQGKGKNNLHSVAEVSGIPISGGGSGSHPPQGKQTVEHVVTVDPKYRHILKINDGPSASQRSGLPAPGSINAGDYLDYGSQ